MTWQPQADQDLVKENYQAVARFYEQLIETEPEVISHYWYLGLAYLLQGRTEEAQATWFYVFAQGSEAEIEQWNNELVEVLAKEAERQDKLGNYSQCWLIRAHIREIAPTQLDNLLQLIELEINQGSFTPKKLKEWQVGEIMLQSSYQKVDVIKLLQVLAKVGEFPANEALDLIAASLPHLEAQSAIKTLLQCAVKMGFQKHHFQFAIELTLLCLKLQPDNLYVLKNLFDLYLGSGKNQAALEIAQQFYDNSQETPLKLYGNYQLLYTLIKMGAWFKVETFVSRHRNLLEQMLLEEPEELGGVLTNCFFMAAYPLPYLQDKPSSNRRFQNHLSRLFQQNLQNRAIAPLKANYFHEARPLKIGYIAHTFRKHSVGWLSRWLFHYHNRENFEVVIYQVNQPEDELTQTWFKQKVDKVRNLKTNAESIVAQIQEDEIDILVDLNSITLDLTCTVMALKPAPIQVTWLGFDASGIPAIDYFIADPFVLPENAQEYYQEKIWRLPQTYVAVDGFEVGVPTTRRKDLEIPSDAVVYLSAQVGMKRNPDFVKKQLQILKAVPNSYLLIKGLADEAVIQEFFTQMAETEGVSATRLRFLARDTTEEIHRANLQIADVVLDTYPYNGATTTLEVLWLGVPLVTRVGEQFAARNSYAFMKNVGLTEGIAYSDEEYVEWGIRLGFNEGLRKKIVRKLKLSRQTSPLWNAKQFTKEMEKAYQQMWAKYCSKKEK